MVTSKQKALDVAGGVVVLTVILFMVWCIFCFVTASPFNGFVTGNGQKVEFVGRVSINDPLLDQAVNICDQHKHWVVPPHGTNTFLGALIPFNRKIPYQAFDDDWQTCQVVMLKWRNIQIHETPQHTIVDDAAGIGH